jgi:hypothetical protein
VSELHRRDDDDKGKGSRERWKEKSDGMTVEVEDDGGSRVIEVEDDRGRRGMHGKEPEALNVGTPHGRTRREKPEALSVGTQQHD